ncbi:larval/pupal cuticle protein H1C-like [Phlebotomus argentipes]|uniref:larval/pupal cuticle protein H1C-like n=1 Tax=Phlebotomus argentipes TaxID=94469 RepID=UPI0028929CC9|nr:larval/pupal cuticle protein H1C-like [Phlebotomus argentipes]
MFKLVVLSAILAVAVAAPSGVSHYAAPILTKAVHYAEPLHATVVKPELERRTYVEVEPQVHVVDTPVVKKVADVVESIPTAVSHQSSTIVHNKEHYVRPVLAHGYEKTIVEGSPIVKTYHEDTPVLKTYTAPIGYAHHYEPHAYAYAAHGYTAPYAHTYAAPYLRYGW